MAIVDMVREDLRAFDRPLSYVGPHGCAAARADNGDVWVVGPWDGTVRRMLFRARAILDLTPDLSRQIVAHWCISGARIGERHLVIVASPEGLAVVRAEGEVRIDDVSGIAVPGALRVVMRTEHGENLDALGEHFARLKCALRHLAIHAP